MSIKDLIPTWLDAELFEVQHSLHFPPVRREVYATSELYERLEGRGDLAEKDAILFAQARQLFDAFIEGRKMSVRMPPSKNVTAQIACLDPLSAGVWDFRVRSPNPGMRVFGFFADRDCFIGIDFAPREALVHDSDWDVYIERCKKVRRKLFHTTTYRGKGREDYVGNSFDPDDL